MSDRSRNAFCLELEPHLEKLYRAAYRLTQSKADAEELVQDTCVRAFSNRQSWAGTQSPLGWLMRVQYNLFVDTARRRKAAVVVSLGDVDAAGLPAADSFDPEARARDAERFAAAHAAWQKLSREQQALLGLRVEGYTLLEMRDITGLSVEALNSRLQRARQSLARHLKTDSGADAQPKRVESNR